MHLFHEQPPQDCFLSGTPDRPDPYDPEYRYWNGLKERVAISDDQSRRSYDAPPCHKGINTIIPRLGKLVLCDPVEDGWYFDNVIELFPDQAA